MVSSNKRGSQPGGEGRRGRRDVLAGAVGAVGVIAAEAVMKATPAQAADGDPVLQGRDNGPATGRTMVFTANNSEFASLADPNSSKGSVGVYGHGGAAGVVGEGAFSNSPGVIGIGLNNGDGVYGIGGSLGSGVFGEGGPSGGPGVFGVAKNGGPGVQGAAQANGDGVMGQATSGNGVHGRAITSTGTGVLAENTAGGTALEVAGPAVFSRSGVLTISAGKSTVTKTGVTLTAASLVLATLQQSRAGIFVQAAVPDVSHSSFTIHLNKAVSVNTKVAWFVVK